MTRTVIFHSDRHELISYGYGEAYAVDDNIDNKSIFVQGDAATEFRVEYDAWQGEYDDFCAEQIAIRE